MGREWHPQILNVMPIITRFLYWWSPLVGLPAFGILRIANVYHAKGEHHVAHYGCIWSIVGAVFRLLPWNIELELELGFIRRGAFLTKCCSIKSSMFSFEPLYIARNIWAGYGKVERLIFGHYISHWTYISNTHTSYIEVEFTTTFDNGPINLSKPKNQ